MQIPAATLVLVAKSKFFAGMFKGEFSERHNKSGGIDIYISQDDEAHFMDLLYFMYSAVIPKHTATSLSTCVRLLVLADRFDVQDCVDEVRRSSPRTLDAGVRLRKAGFRCSLQGAQCCIA